MQGQANRTLTREEENEDGFQLSLSNEDFRPLISPHSRFAFCGKAVIFIVRSTFRGNKNYADLWPISERPFHRELFFPSEIICQGDN